MIKSLKILIVLISLSFSGVCHAVTTGFKELVQRMTVGAELEFMHKDYDWNDVDIVGPKAQKAKQLFRDEVIKSCASLNCKVAEVKGKYSNDFRVTFADGWYFTISHDPGVIEITWKALTLDQVKQKSELINKSIFQSAKNGGFEPKHDESAHYNIGVKSVFGDNTLDFVRFFVDYQNNNFLALGTLGEDLDNAPPLSVLGADQRDALAKILQQVDQGKINSIGEAAEAIFKNVYTRSYNPSWGAEWGAEAGVRHYQAIGLKYVTIQKMLAGDVPMEMRAVWSTVDAENFIKVGELLAARIAFLKTQKDPIRYFKSGRKIYNSWEEAVSRFYIYVTESGLEFEKYKSLLPDEAQDIALAAFLDSKASISKRLKSLKKYSDLAQSSEAFRKLAEELIDLGHTQGFHDQDSLLANIQKGREARVLFPYCPSILISK